MLDGSIPDAGPLGAAVFDRVADRAYALDRGFRFVAVNAACERHFGVARDEVLGRVIWEAFPSYLGRPDEAALRRVMAGGAEERFEADSHVLPGLRLEVQVFPLGDGVGVVFRDVTPADAAVAAREAAAAQLRDSRAATAAALAELQSIYDSAPVGLCVIGRDRRFRRINRRMAEINGVPAEAHLGRTLAEVLPGYEGPLEPLFRAVFERGEAVHDVEVAGEKPHRPGEVRHSVVHWLPLRDARGEVTAVNVVVEDVSRRKEAEARERLLVRELDHRTKNVLAVVQSLIRLGAARAGEGAADFAEAMEGRVAALSRAHAQLAAGRWDALDMGDLVRGELEPHAEGDRARALGPPLPLAAAAAQAIAMAVHELATNAAKYGSLSCPEGGLDVSWRREGGEVVVEWRERGGPPVEPPRRDGFGSQLVRTLVEFQLGGRVAPCWNRGGFSCTMTLPAAAVLGG